MSTNFLNHKIMKQLRTFSVMLAFLGLSVNGALAQTNQTVTFAGWDGVGTIQSTIQSAINTVNGAGGGTVTINGEKTNVDAKLAFTIPENVTVVWKAKYKGDLDEHLIAITGDGALEIAEGADVEATFSDEWSAFYLGIPKVKISGGAVTTNSVAIYCNALDADFEMTGGILTADIYYYEAVWIESGHAKVSGGEIKATGDGSGAIASEYADITISGNAKLSALIGGGIVVSTNGNITVSGNPVITGTGVCISSPSITISGGTITSPYAAVESYGEGAINISGGTIAATGTGYAVYCYDNSKVNITGGKALAQDGYAIYIHEGTGSISGGIGFAYGTAVTDVIVGPFTVPPVNSAVMVAWNKAAGNTTYTAGSSNDIYKLPATATAVWAKQGSDSGISVTSGSTTGFIPIDGITVEGETGIGETHGIVSIQVYPNPVKDVLNFSFETSYKITDLQGRILQESDIAVKSANISHLPKGIYLVTLITKTGKLVKKIIKE